LKKLSLDGFMRLRKLVFRGARPLEFTMWKAAFENGSMEDFLGVVSAYQNEDGGFGHNMEANLWNPNSSPEITAYALGQIERAGRGWPEKDHPIVKGVLKYLASGAYATETGWICGIPSNLDYSHAPWFGYDPQNEIVRLLDPLVDFIFRYADPGSAFYHKAVALDTIRKSKKPAALPDFKDFDPSKFEPWNESPVSFVRSPDSAHYPAYQKLVDAELDAMVDRLHGTNELPVASYKDCWEDAAQVIGSYYWASSDFIHEVQTLDTFGRLEFLLPILMEA